MKGDFTRNTFDGAKRYSSVRMQQGRVQLDADWNEQADITLNRIETEAADIIGGCGAPIGNDGFRIVATAAGLTPAELARPGNASPPALEGAGDFLITSGRMYVGGVLCTSDRIESYCNQTDLPDLPAVTLAGTYVAYLDVWTRHITPNDDPSIREVALGGPDTATRGKTIRQVKLLRVGDAGAAIECGDTIAAWNDLVAPPNGRLAAQSVPDAESKNPCIVAPGAGYRRLENQLYRVEVHDGGPRGTATFKWSRDNGSVAARWESTDASGNILTLSGIGPDATTRFAIGNWVELIDERRELQGIPGTLVRLKNVKGRTIEIDPATARAPLATGNDTVDINDFPLNPRVRRWDNVEVDGVLKPTNNNWVDLEDGVQVRITAGTYRTGDYWLVPARVETEDVEWPTDTLGNALDRAPHGIRHNYCRLAVMSFSGAAWTSISDCRRLFPPITALTSLFYLGGDGQEIHPDTGNPAALLPLPRPLRVGVANGEFPVVGARVRFRVITGNGRLNGTGNDVILPTLADGSVECPWELDSTNVSQVVEARLLDMGSDPTHLAVRFNASLSLASRVAYAAGACDSLAGARTVQEALDLLCQLTGEGCAIPIKPGPDWQQTLVLLAEGKEDLHFCFRAGEYELTEPIRLIDKQSVVISGAGPGTQINGRGTETIFHFEDVDNVTLRDFQARSGGTPSQRGHQSGLDGVVTAANCGNVTIERVTIRCAPDTLRASSCIAVRNGVEDEDEGRARGMNITRVRGCHLMIGHGQSGLLAINTARVSVVDNTLEGSGRPSVETIRRELTINPKYRTAVSNMVLGISDAQRRTFSSGRPITGETSLARDVTPGTSTGNELAPTPGRATFAVDRSAGLTSMAKLSFNVTAFNFELNTPAELAPIWVPLLEQRMKTGAETRDEIVANMREVVDDLVAGKIEGAARATFDNWIRDVLARSPAVASQGIVVGGSTAPEVQIRGNSLRNVRQGIHIGVSHREADRGTPDQAGVIRIVDNIIGVRLAGDMRGERHGIFVGNCESLIAERNYVNVARDAASVRLRTEGIRIFGHFGPMMIARANHIEGASVGIRVTPLNPDENKINQWLVADTMASGASPVVEAPPAGVRLENNFG